MACVDGSVEFVSVESTSLMVGVVGVGETWSIGNWSEGDESV